MDNNPKPKPPRPTLDEVMRRIKWPLNRFFLFLLIAVIFAVSMGITSYGIYRISDAASLDLSLPAHQKKIRDDKLTPPEKALVIESTGIVDAIFAQQVADYIQQYQDSVGEAQPFAPDALLDENLINVTNFNLTE